MMKTINISVSIALICCLIGFSSPAFGSTLVYEREYASFERGDNTLRMTLDERGLLTVDRPSFMTNPGRHVFQVSPAQYLELSARLADFPFTSEELNTAVLQRVEEEMVYISHPEYTRFQLLDHSRNIGDSIEILSLQAYSSQFTDNSNLSTARELEEQWWEIMNHSIEVLTEGESND